MRRFFFVLLIAAGLFSSLLFSSPCFAAESTVQITPTLLEFETVPGKAYSTSEIVIFNPSVRQRQRIELVIRDLTVADETGTYGFFNVPHERFSLSTWAEVNPKVVTLEPQEAQGVTVQIDTPLDAEAGGHYGILLALAKPETEEELPEGVMVRNTGGVGLALLGTTPGDISWAGRIIEFQPVPFLNTGPVNFSLRFANDGTVHYSPHGTIEIFDLLGGKVGEVEIKEQRVFPQKIRRLETVWKRILLVGKYTAKATVYYGKEGEERVDTAEITFWAFPYKAFLILVGVVVCVVIISKVRKRVEER